jgi:hypothetical protein
MGWVVNATPWPLYPRGRDAVPASGPVWTGAENLVPTENRSPDRPARSESLYRLRYPGPEPEKSQRHKWENMGTDLGATECKDVDRIHLAPHRDLWRALVSTGTYLMVLK